VDPGEGWPPITGVISPLSACAMVLTVFRTQEAEFQRHFLHTAMAGDPQDTASLFSDVVDGVLRQIPSSYEDPESGKRPSLGLTVWLFCTVVFQCQSFQHALSRTPVH
jgi:hypothetical protein